MGRKCWEKLFLRKILRFVHKSWKKPFYQFMNIIGFQAHFWCIHAQFLSLNLISEILAALKEHLEGLHLIVCLTSPLPPRPLPGGSA